MRSPLNSLSTIFGIVMIVVLVSGAMAIMFTDFMGDRLYGNKRIFFVVLLLAYSLYRGFRVYRSFVENRNEE